MSTLNLVPLKTHLVYEYDSLGTSSRIGNTVLVKLANGQTKQMTKLHKRPFDLVKVPKNSVPTPKSPRSLIAVKKPTANLTPSVSIAPVGKKTMPMSMSTSDTESDSEELAAMSIPKPKRTYTYYNLIKWHYCQYKI